MTPEEFSQRLERLPDVVAAETRRAIEASLILIEGDARTLTPRDVGRLQGSISYQISGSGLALEGRVGPSVLYGAPVEFGRRAGARMPPVDALLGWVQRHFAPSAAAQAAIANARFGGPVRNRAWRAAGDAALRRRAFALARTIARRGIAPHPFMEPAYTRNAARITALFDNVGVRVVASLAGRQL